MIINDSKRCSHRADTLLYDITALRKRARVLAAPVQRSRSYVMRSGYPSGPRMIDHFPRGLVINAAAENPLGTQGQWNLAPRNTEGLTMRIPRA
jgi:hypothetical protein